MPSLDQPDMARLPKLVDPMDDHAKISGRVRSYIESNCSPCHRPGVGIEAMFDGRYSTPLAAQGLVDGVLFDTRGDREAKVVSSGQISHSMMLKRMMSTKIGTRMPPLGRKTQDRQAIALFDQWITKLGKSY